MKKITNLVVMSVGGYQKYCDYNNDGNKDNFNYDPIFILGMPRSGTTLVEQILSSHPDVFGGGEITQLSAIMNKFFPQSYKNGLFVNLENCRDSIFKDLGSEYIKYIRKFSLSNGIIPLIL